MTRETRSISIPADARSHGVALAVALAALALLGGVAAGTATAQSERATIVVTDGTTTPDGTTTVGIVLTNAPSGLSGYYLDLTVGNPDVARIEAGGYPDGFGLTSEPAIRSDGATVTLEAADVEGAVEPGATDVTLATVTLAGAAPGEATLTVEPRGFDDDDGSAFTPATAAGTITVSGSDGDPSADGSTDAGDSGESNTDGSDAGGSPEAASDGDAGSSADTGVESTEGDGPLPAVLVPVAVGLLVAARLRRRT